MREFELTAQEVDWELFPGATVKAWAYNGTVPGPELRVTEGDLVRVVFTNQLAVPTAVHWHGLDVPVAMDGVPGLTQQAVPPGGRFVYEFVATNVGTRWYHSHQDAELQGPLGLYGPLIVEPRTPEPVVYDREVTFVLSEWDLGLTPAVARGDAPAPRGGRTSPCPSSWTTTCSCSTARPTRRSRRSRSGRGSGCACACSTPATCSTPCTPTATASRSWPRTATRCRRGCS